MVQLEASDIPNFSSGMCKYLIINGICFVYIMNLYLSNTSLVEISALPACYPGWYVDIRLGSGLELVGEISTIFGRATFQIWHQNLSLGMWGQFCYPIA